MGRVARGGNLADGPLRHHLIQAESIMRLSLRSRLCSSGLLALLALLTTSFAAAQQEPAELPDVRRVPSPAIGGFNADPHIAVFGDRYYIYPTFDGNEGWGSTAFPLYSSTDLVHWQHHGIIVHLPYSLPWAGERAWAPAIAEYRGKYYFYMSANRNIAVAVADRPEGPFVDPLGKPLVAEGEYEGQMIDPMTFIDDDGTPYLYWGNGRCYVARLNEDMISLAERGRDITPPDFREGVFMVKRQGKYYLMWSEDDTRSPNYRVAYAIGDSPYGPFTKADNNPILIGDGVIRGTGHHSVVKVPGQDRYYIAYHRFGTPDGNGFKRETVIGDLVFEEDGTIRKVDIWQPHTPLND